jgi:MFS family permease
MNKSVQLFLTRLPKLGEILHLNRILYVLIASDFIIISAYGLMAPIFAVFLTEKIIGGSLVIVGISEAIYLLSTSLLQVPLGILIDKTKGQKIDFWFLFIGSLIMSFSLFLYIWSSEPWHIYLISLFYGIGSAFSYPAWAGLFTRNIVENKESFAWSLSTTFVGIGRSIAALIGSVIGEIWGFPTLFAIVGSISLLGTFILFAFYNDLVESSNDL